jgi:hypothetical protein
MPIFPKRSKSDDPVERFRTLQEVSRRKHVDLEARVGELAVLDRRQREALSNFGADSPEFREARREYKTFEEQVEVLKLDCQVADEDAATAQHEVQAARNAEREKGLARANKDFAEAMAQVSSGIALAVEGFQKAWRINQRRAGYFSGNPPFGALAHDGEIVKAVQGEILHLGGRPDLGVPNATPRPPSFPGGEITGPDAHLFRGQPHRLPSLADLVARGNAFLADVLKKRPPSAPVAAVPIAPAPKDLADAAPVPVTQTVEAKPAHEIQASIPKVRITLDPKGHLARPAHDPHPPVTLTKE